MRKYRVDAHAGDRRGRFTLFADDTCEASERFDEKFGEFDGSLWSIDEVQELD